MLYVSTPMLHPESLKILQLKLPTALSSSLKQVPECTSDWPDLVIWPFDMGSQNLHTRCILYLCAGIPNLAVAVFDIFAKNSGGIISPLQLTFISNFEANVHKSSSSSSSSFIKHHIVWQQQQHVIHSIHKHNRCHVTVKLFIDAALLYLLQLVSVFK